MDAIGCAGYNSHQPTVLGIIGDDKELPDDGYRVVSSPSQDIPCSDIFVAY